jgi:hypothetical protein
MTESDELPMLIKRALAYGIEIWPLHLNGVLKSYEYMKIPDDVLGKMKRDQVGAYLKALYLCSCEMSGDWLMGHEMLKDLGFVEIENSDGHRIFISKVYDQLMEERKC